MRAVKLDDVHVVPCGCGKGLIYWDGSALACTMCKKPVLPADFLTRPPPVKRGRGQRRNKRLKNRPESTRRFEAVVTGPGRAAIL